VVEVYPGRPGTRVQAFDPWAQATGRRWAREAGLALLLLLSCNPPTGVDKPNPFRSRGGQSAPASAGSGTLRERMLGSWEVVAVGGRPIDQVPEDEVPFRQIRIEPNGRLRMDTFQTEYEVAGEKDGVISLSYSVIGRESFLEIRLASDGSVEIVETYRDPATGAKGSARVTARRVL
jgi:hypothetical protein